MGTFSICHGRIKTSIPLPQSFENVDDFAIMHQVRDGVKFTTPTPSMSTSIAVLGGGISGLTAMSRLASYETLLVDKEPQLGGNSRRRRKNGIDYPLGAIVSQGAEEPFTDFFNKLKINFQPIDQPELAYFCQRRLILDPLNKGINKLPFNKTIRRQFSLLRDQLGQYLDPQKGIFFPIEDNTQAIKSLDKITLYEYLQSQQYGSDVIHFCNLLVSSRLGTTTEHVSAWMGLYILSKIVGVNYTLPGGHGVISEALINTINDQPGQHPLITSSAAIKVQKQNNGKVWTTCINKDNDLFTIESDCVIFAGPKLIAKKIVDDLPLAQRKAMSRFRYSAYLVAQISLSKPVALAFETVTDSLFSRFIVAADWTVKDPIKNNSHITVYVPFPGRKGRTALYNAQADQIAQQIIDDVISVYPEARSAIQEITIHRWGHPMVMPEPGITKRITQARQPFENIFFAHSDNMGISGLYSAVWAGMDAYTSAMLHLDG